MMPELLELLELRAQEVHLEPQEHQELRDLLVKQDLLEPLVVLRPD
jgi:hypothetical protein